MRQTPDMQESGAESQESVVGDGVPCNGVDGQAARRVHMRELTTARQAAEQRLHPSGARGRHDFYDQVTERVVEVRSELARINAEHQTWLQEHPE